MSEKYTMEGQLVEVGETQTFASGFTKRAFVLDDDKSGKYANPVQFTVTKDRCEILNGMRVGEVYTVTFFINGRKWEGDRGTKYFTDLSALTITDANGNRVTATSNTPATYDKVTDWASLKAFADLRGVAELALGEKCRAYCKANKIAGSKDFKPENWVAVAKEIADENGHTVTLIDDNTADDMPF